MIEIAGIRTESLGDGIGVRTVIFFQGCTHYCYECHNPDTWEIGNGQLVTMQYLLNIIKNDALSYGVTFSGGCPMCNNIDEIIKLAKEIKLLGKNIWCYCGERFEELTIKQKELLQYIDVLVDGKYIHELRDLTLAFRGSKNQRIIDVKKTLESGNIIILK